MNSTNNSKVSVAVDPYSIIAQTVGSVTSDITSYLETRESNKTERSRIQAALDTAIKLIESDTEKFRLYIEHEYKDKDKLYLNAEKIIDKGIIENDLKMLQIGCDLMMYGFNKNPLKDYKTQIDFSNTTSSFFQSNFIKRIEE